MEEEEDYLYGEPSSVPAPSRSKSPSFAGKGPPGELENSPMANNPEEQDEEQAMEEEGSDSDIEIITDRVPMALDNRAKKGPALPGTQPLQASTTSSSLTTEYTPRERVSSSSQILTSDSSSSQLPPPLASEPSGDIGNGQAYRPVQPAIDTSQLPPATAPPSHPRIDPAEVGIQDSRPIFEHDMDSLADKPWRRPGSNLSDWFNYGFDEISWEAYCYRRRQLGEDAAVLRANVINFSGLADEQVTNLPPEVRSMVMTGTTTLMNNQQTASMMNMNPMMGDLSGMQMPMGMMGMPTMPNMHGMVGNDGGPYPMSNVPQQPGGDSVESLPPQHEAPARPTSAVQHGGPIQEYQAQQDVVSQSGTYSSVDSNNAPPTGGRGGGVHSGSFRGRGGVQPPQAPARGRTPYRGRGRGGVYVNDNNNMTPPPVPVRSASPLPPGVPTGPRNANRYKDRDGNTPAAEGLDYGSTKQDPHGYYESDDRRSRKRRGSPGLDDYSGRGSKRR